MTLKRRLHAASIDGSSTQFVGTSMLLSLRGVYGITADTNCSFAASANDEVAGHFHTETVANDTSVISG